MSRSRFTLTKRIMDDFYVSQSFYPNVPKPKVWGLVLAAFAGAAIFLLAVLLVISLAGP